MPRPRTTTVRFNNKEAADASPLLLKPDCEPSTATIQTPFGVIEVTGMQGWRKTMEDAHFVAGADQLPRPFIGALAVFDGHVNSNTANFLAQRLVPALAATISERFGQEPAALVEAAQSGALHQVAAEVSAAVDAEHRAQAVEPGGSTAAGVLLTDTHYLMFSTGDARVVAIRGVGTVEGLENDHRPTTHAADIARLQANGHRVEGGRVNGVLSVTRAFGDFNMKPIDAAPDTWAIISTPDVVLLPRAADDKTVLVGCDGAWELHDATVLSDAVLASAQASAAGFTASAASSCVSRTAQISEALHSVVPPGCDNVSLGAIVFS